MMSTLQHQVCSTQKGLTSLNLSIFGVNNFYCVTIQLNINRFTIYGGKCLGIVTLKVIPTACFRYNSEELGSKFRYEFPSASSIIKCLEDFEKMTVLYHFFCPCFSNRLHLFQSFTIASAVLLLNGLAMVTNEESIAYKCFKK